MVRVPLAATAGSGRTIRGYVELCRVSNLPSVWTNVLCAFVLATGGFSWKEYRIAAFALSCFYLAGMSLNDICDAAHDQVNRPTRPIPAGTVSLAGAWLLTVALCAAAYAALLFAPCRQGLSVALILTAAIVWYDLRHKKNPLSVLLMASCRFLVFPVTAVAVAGKVGLPVLAAGGVQFLYVLVISVVARHENARPTRCAVPVVPTLLAGIPLLDGMILAILVHPAWLLAGVAGALLMLGGQRVVSGD